MLRIVAQSIWEIYFCRCLLLVSLLCSVSCLPLWREGYILYWKKSRWLAPFTVVRRRSCWLTRIGRFVFFFVCSWGFIDWQAKPGCLSSKFQRIYKVTKKIVYENLLAWGVFFVLIFLIVVWKLVPYTSSTWHFLGQFYKTNIEVCVCVWCVGVDVIEF